MVVKRFINTECISFGITFNWNWRPSIEVSVFFWTIEIECEWERMKKRLKGGRKNGEQFERRVKG